MAASIRPRPPAKSPLMSEGPASVPINVIPMIAMTNSSGEPKSRTNGRMIGMEMGERKGADYGADEELIIAAPKARPASPFLDIG